MDAIDAFHIIKLIAALAFVVALMGGLAIMMKRLGLTEGSARFSQKRRMNVQESLSIDSKRKAVIIRCDNEEHLFLLGAASEIFVKTLNNNTPKPTNTPTSGKPVSGKIRTARPQSFEAKKSRKGMSPKATNTNEDQNITKSHKQIKKAHNKKRPPIV